DKNIVQRSASAPLYQLRRGVIEATKDGQLLADGVVDSDTARVQRSSVREAGVEGSQTGRMTAAVQNLRAIRLWKDVQVWLKSRRRCLPDARRGHLCQQDLRQAQPLAFV